MNEIIEGNKLIAEFTGGQFYRLDDGFGKISEVMYFHPGNHPNPHCGMGTYKNISELEYQIRWDWLMPVIEKIRSLWNEKSLDLQLLEENSDASRILHQRLWTPIENAWLAVVEFIKWYNTNKK